MRPEVVKRVSPVLPAFEVCPADPKVFEVTDVSRVTHLEACLECGLCVDNYPTVSIKLID